MAIVSGPANAAVRCTRATATSNKHASVARTLKPIQSDTTTELIKLCLANALSTDTATRFAADAFEGNVKEFEMQRPAEMDIVRRAYELWEQAGKPDGRDQEFYHQAEQELQKANEQAIPEQPR
jgi:hypothetical protein